jgi:hypothetical protein
MLLLWLPMVANFVRNSPRLSASGRNFDGLRGAGGQRKGRAGRAAGIGDGGIVERGVSNQCDRLVADILVGSGNVYRRHIGNGFEERSKKLVRTWKHFSPPYDSE